MMSLTHAGYSTDISTHPASKHESQLHPTASYRILPHLTARTLLHPPSFSTVRDPGRSQVPDVASKGCLRPAMSAVMSVIVEHTQGTHSFLFFSLPCRNTH